MCAQRLSYVWNRRSKESPLDAWNILSSPSPPTVHLRLPPPVSHRSQWKRHLGVALTVGNAAVTVLLL